MSFSLTGTCNCGAVGFEVTEPLERATYCHCTRCQRRSGAAASANARVAPGAFRMLRGSERLRSWAPPDGSEKFFCGDCGSHLFSRGVDAAGEESIGVRLGALDDDPGVRPGLRQHTGSAAVWEPLPDDGLPRFPGPAATPGC